jgi:hypothetical protein
MGKKADIHPRWLVSLMCQWVRRQEDLQGGALGYPSQAAFLTVGRSTAAHTDPTGFSAKEFDELERTLESCRVDETSLWAALMMYYKPWVIESFKAEGWPFAPNRIYWENLVRAHEWVSSRILSTSAMPESYAV